MPAVLRQAWQQDDAAKAERLLRNLARRLEQNPASRARSGGPTILTVSKHSLAAPTPSRTRSATVQRNVKRWRNAEMAALDRRRPLGSAKTFRRLKAYRQLPVLDAALREAVRKAGAKSVIEDIKVAA